MAEPKVAIITGSSSGIGLLTAVEFAANGYRVVATMRDLGRSGRLEEAAQKAGVRDRLDLRRLDVTRVRHACPVRSSRSLAITGALTCW